jgi:predicted nucleotidyltransferase
MQTSTAQSYLRFPLTHLLASGGHVRVLRALLSYGAPLSVSQLAADCGMSSRGVRYVLDSLVSQRAVRVLGQPRAQLFAAAAEHPLLAAAAVLFEQERNRWESLQTELREGLAAHSHIRSAWLYGSVSRGEDEPRSDLDLAVAVDDDALDVTQHVRDAVQELGDRLGVAIAMVVLTPADVVRIAQDDRWWAEMVQDARVLKGVAPGREAARAMKAATPTAAQTA